MASTDTKPQHGQTQPNIEYSSREVSPAPLLLSQVLKAHRIFLLHHGPSINDLFVKVSRDKFCGILDRFWSRFCRNWEVLLHGNPAVDVFGGMKLAAGGELGVGVGEEEWGSGEREVLEDLIRQTEGLVDLTVSRFGQAAPPELDSASDKPSKETLADAEAGLPWLGCGQLPGASDGVIFSGTGAIARPALRNLSEWIQQIYTYGEHAYGVKDNPQRAPYRKRRRRQPPVEEPAKEGSPRTDLRKKALEQSQQHQQQKPEVDLEVELPHDPRPQMHDRVASHDHATGTSTPQVASHPGIPPPIVSAVENSLNAASRSASATRAASPGDKQPASRFGVSDKWMGYLTLGLSNIGTNNTTTSSSTPKRPGPLRQTSSSSSRTIRVPPSKGSMRLQKASSIPEDDENGPLKTLDPAPDGYKLHAQIERQIHQENRGHFLVGFKGDLGKPPANDNDNNEDMSDTEADRVMLRTVHIEIPQQQPSYDDQRPGSPETLPSDTEDDETPSTTKYQRYRVLVYVHRPFIYTLLFEQRAPVLQITSFYSKIHSHFLPLHKPLLSSTSLESVAQRIAEAHVDSTSPSATNTETASLRFRKSNPVFDLVHDPLTLSTHTSIPNIPDPGTPAAEGFATTSTGRNGPPDWTRMEAINVHSQILNTLIATKPNKSETERTSKTSRGWWVVWMRIPSSPSEDGPLGRHRDVFEDCRTAFLVRKASDGLAGPVRAQVGAGTGGSRVGSMSGMFGGLGGFGGFGLGGGGGGGPSASEEREEAQAQAVGWGLGIDARKYVEGLLSLNR